MNLWIITVNFGDPQPTMELVDSLSFLENDCTIKLAIADNLSTKNSLSKLKKLANESIFETKIYPNNKNIYYWPAAIKLISTLKQNLGLYPDWVIVCNNDITFPDKNFFKILKKINLKDFPIIGPKIIDSIGQELNPFMYSPLSMIEKFYWNIYFISYPFSLIMILINKFIKFINFKKQPKNNQEKSVYAVHGSFILFSNYFFKKGGWFDDNFEMYGEELTVAEIAKKLDIPVSYFPELQIIHNEHRSTKKIDNRLLYIKAKKTYKYFKSAYLK